MIAAYLRYSTSHQDETQQMQVLNEYTKPRGITIDVIEKDEGVSGGVSYKDRRLYGLVKKMKAGDTLICSEISRLGRSMSDISNLLSMELKPRKIRLIVVKMGIDVDCSNLKATDEFIFSALSFAAQIEKELIQSRTQAGIDARKELIKTDGGFISKSGNFCSRLGNPKGVDMTPAQLSSISRRIGDKNEWRKTGLFAWVELQIRKGRSRKDIVAEAQEMFKKDPERWGTRQGRPLSEAILSRWVKDILPVI